MADDNVTDAPVDTGDNSESTTIEPNDAGDGAPEPTAGDVAAPEPAAADAAPAGEPTEVVPDWPDDWRDKLAKDDSKMRKRLDRFKSPADVLNSWQALEKKLSSGDLKTELPADATDEQVAAFRKEHGIPETPSGYLDKLPDGLVIGEADKDLVNGYIEQAHGHHAAPEVVAATLDWYYKNQEDQIAAQAELDQTTQRANEDDLRAEWGNEYRANLNSINNFLESAPAADDGTPLKDLILGSRMSDGTPMGNHPAMLRWLARLSDDANPAGFISPGAGLSQAESVKDQIDSIEKVMRTDRATYNKDTKMQERLRVLYDADAKLSA